MRTRAAVVATLLLAAFALGAQEATPPLAVRKDALRPGWFFVGVVPGIGTDVPILIELQSGSASAPVRKFRSPQPRSFDLCSLLRSAGVAEKAGPVFLLVSRGAASFRFSVPYDGKLCAAPAATPPSEETAKTAGSGGLAPLVLTLPPPPEPVEPAPPAVAQATPVPTRPVLAAPPAVAEATPVPTRPVVAVPPPEQRPAPPPAATVAAPAAPTRPPAVPAPPPAHAPAPTAVAVARAAPPVVAPGAPEVTEPVREQPGLSASERGLTSENFEGLSAFLLRDAALGTNDIRFVLRFKRPVNVEGVESVVFLRARIVKGRSFELLDRGQENFIDPVDDPANTLSISTTVPMGLALETAGVNHVVTVEIQVGTEPALGVFEGRVGIKRGLEK